MRKRGKIKKIAASAIAILLVLMMLLSLFGGLLSLKTAAALTKQEQIAELEEEAAALREKGENLSAQREETWSEQQSVLEKKIVLEEQAEVTRLEILNTEEQIRLYDEQVAQKEQEYAEVRAAEAEQEELFETRVRAMEEYGTISYFEILFSAESFSDLLTKLSIIRDIVAYDNSVAEELAEMRKEVAAVKLSIEADRVVSEELDRKLLEKKKLLENQIQEALDLVNSLQDDIDALAAFEAEVEAQEVVINQKIDGLEEEIRKEEEERKRKEEEERKRKEEEEKQLKLKEAAAAAAAAAAQSKSETETQSSYTYVGTGSFIWPTPSCYWVTSEYGYRFHPVYQYYRFHAGIDIGANYGEAIVAADGGTVIQASYSSGYGNLIIIDHGNGYTTRYGHLSSYAVSSGDYVSQGQTIGYIGSTGVSTGPHLHFEIRYNGETTDPMGYYS